MKVALYINGKKYKVNLGDEVYQIYVKDYLNN